MILKFSACLFLFVLQNYLTLLDDEDHTLENLKIQDEQQLVIEGMKDHLESRLITFFSITNPVKTLNVYGRREVYLHKVLSLPTQSGTRT